MTAPFRLRDRVLGALRLGPMTAGQVTTALCAGRANVDRHLATLAAAGRIRSTGPGHCRHPRFWHVAESRTRTEETETVKTSDEDLAAMARGRVKSGLQKQTEATRRIVRIEGEVLTVGEIAGRLGQPVLAVAKRARRLQRESVLTWAGLRGRAAKARADVWR